MSISSRIRVALFAVVAVVSVVVAGVEYVGIPERYLGRSYEIAADLPESGGIFPNAEVTLRGVPVGRVKSLELTPDGVRAHLQLDDDIRVADDTLVRVAHLSAVGEQYVQLIPPDDDGPYLAAGEVLPVSAARTPQQVTDLLVHLDRLATSIGKPKLRQVVDELGTAFSRSGQDLATVLVRTNQLSDDLVAIQPRTSALLRDGERMLRTQHELAPDLRALSDGLDRLTRTLAESDPELEAILAEAPATLDDVRRVLAANQADVGVLLGNLLSVGEIVAEPIRLRGLNTQLVLLPRIIQGTFNIQPGDGYARLGAVIDTTQAVCTRGYESSGTPPTQGHLRSAEPGNPPLRANLNAFCAEPRGSRIGVRGAANVPRPPGDPTAQVLTRDNPRGFGPGASSAEEDPAPTTDPPAESSADAAANVRMLPATDLQGLILKEDLR
ncbi:MULTISPECIES: MCE family protein [unclassified Nocardioides]|uniref:MCE family protein n=1 Tax=unclassified Nocardioides TaxID=2615069 RepID=UPI0036201CC1